MNNDGTPSSFDEYVKAYEKLKAENKMLRGEKPIPVAWWKDCPGLAQKTMERIIDKNEKLQADMVTAQAVKEQLVWDRSTLQDEVVELQAENKEHKKLFRQILSWTENIIGTMLADKIKEALKGGKENAKR